MAKTLESGTHHEQFQGAPKMPHQQEYPVLALQQQNASTRVPAAGSTKPSDPKASSPMMERWKLAGTRHDPWSSEARRGVSKGV
ncbi:hypothetical protein MKZ38_005466 [Zalerion maritima]|uniref:Uncharacterized protein n=1 Tax=Zalerion maritima TaxID=339359 RepID=A0AAD5RKN6_9PEZI|nr:hypothetical protein MKZ38_005466 [Zalerion maritima]